MSNYRIIIRTHPDFNNAPINRIMKLTPSQLYGVAIMATSLLDIERDQYFEIRSRELGTLNLDDVIEASGAVLLEGDPAFDTDPQPGVPWLQVISDVARAIGSPLRITQPYTVKVDGTDTFIVQFSDPQFLQGLYMLATWFGLNPIEYLRDLHQQNTPLNIGQFLQQSRLL